MRRTNPTLFLWWVRAPREARAGGEAVSEITWHTAGTWKDKRVARSHARRLREKVDGYKFKARVKKEIWWRTEYALEWSGGKPAPKGGNER